MLNRIRILNLKDLQNLKLISPITIQFEFMNAKLYFNFNNRSLKNLYSVFNSDTSFSKKMFNMAPDIWSIFFSFDKIQYEDYSIIVDPENLIVLDFFLSEDGITNNFKDIKITNNILHYNHENVFFILSLNTEKSVYSVYALQLENNILYPTIGKLCSTYNLHDFIQYDVEADAKLYKLISQTVDIQEFYKYNTINISLQELLYIVKNAKLNIELDKNGLIEFVDEDSNNIFISYLNSFNLPYNTLKKLDKIQQAAMYKEVNIEDILRYITDKCLNGQVDVELLMYIYNMIKYSNYDKLKESGVI